MPGIDIFGILWCGETRAEKNADEFHKRRKVWRTYIYNMFIGGCWAAITAYHLTSPHLTGTKPMFERILVRTLKTNKVLSAYSHPIPSSAFLAIASSTNGLTIPAPMFIQARTYYKATAHFLREYTPSMTPQLLPKYNPKYKISASYMSQ